MPQDRLSVTPFPLRVLRTLCCSLEYIKKTNSPFYSRGIKVSLPYPTFQWFLSALGKVQLTLQLEAPATLPLRRPTPSLYAPATLCITPGGMDCRHQVLSEIHSTTFSRSPLPLLNSS